MSDYKPLAESICNFFSFTQFDSGLRSKKPQRRIKNSSNSYKNRRNYKSASSFSIVRTRRLMQTEIEDKSTQLQDKYKSSSLQRYLIKSVDNRSKCEPGKLRLALPDIFSSFRLQHSPIIETSEYFSNSSIRPVSNSVTSSKLNVLQYRSNYCFSNIFDEAKNQFFMTLCLF